MENTLNKANGTEVKSSEKQKSTTSVKKSSSSPKKPSTKKVSPKDEFIEVLKKRDKAMSAKIGVHRYRGKESEQRRCPVCNVTLKSYDRFCSWCGQRIQEDKKEEKTKE